MNKKNRIIGYNLYFKIAMMLFIVFTIGCKSKIENSSKLFEDSFFSEYLNEERILTLYFPNNFDVNKKYNIVYATDGQIIDETYKLELDRLIRNGEIEPTIIVGVNSNEKEVEDTGLNFRNFEYVKNLSTEPNLSQLYEKHYFFFTKEVINYIHKKYNLEIGNKVFYGCSNGAGFGFNLMCDSDNIFDYFFLFSISGADRSLINDLHETKSNVYISYGDKEPFPLIENIKIIEKELNDKNYHFYLNVFKGGHSRKSWEKEFFIALKRLNRN